MIEILRAKIRRLRIPLTAALLLLTVAMLLLTTLLMYGVSRWQLDAYFGSGESEYAQMSGDAFVKSVEIRLDGMSLSCDFLSTNTWVARMLAQYEAHGTPMPQRLQIKSNLTAMLQSVCSESADGLSLSLVSDAGSRIYASDVEGGYAFGWGDVDTLLRSDRAVADSKGVYYVHSGDPGMPKVARNYFDDKLCMIFPVNIVGARWYLVAGVAKDQLLQGGGLPPISAELLSGVGERVSAVGAEALDQGADIQWFDQYPYGLRYAISPLVDASYDQIRSAMTVMLGVVIALGSAYFVRRRLLGPIHSLQQTLSAHRSGKEGPRRPPTAAISLRGYGMMLVIMALLAPALLYALGYSGYARSVLVSRAQTLTQRRADVIFNNLTAYFEKKNGVSRALKYAKPIQSFLQGKDTDRENILHLIKINNYQNAFADDFYFFNTAGELVTTNAELAPGLGGLAAEALQGPISAWSYAPLLHKGRQNNWTFSRLDPISNVFGDLNPMLLQPIGWLRVDTQESELYSVYIGDIGRLNGALYVCNKAGQILSASDRRRMGDAVKPPDAEEVVRNGDVICLARYLTAAESWVVIEANLGTLTSDVDQFIANTMLRLLLIAGLGALALHVPIRLLLRPLADTERSLSEMTLGQVLQLPRSSISEIDRLNQAFEDMTLRMKQMIDEVYVLKLNTTTARLQMLRAQLDPHFLNNTLETINCTIQLQEYDLATQMLTDLGRFYRYNIREERQWVRLEDEIRCAQYYCNIQAACFGDRLQLSWNCSEEALKVRLPGFILQPLVENAFIHGLSRMTGEARLWVDAVVAEERLEIRIRDNGRGMPEARIRELMDSLRHGQGDHVGLHNVAERIRLIYGERGLFVIEANESRGVQVRLSLPLQDG